MTFMPIKKSGLGLFILALTLLLFSLPSSVLAQQPAIEPYIVTLMPKSSVEVVVNGYCLNRGLPFPGKEMSPVGLAPDEVRRAIVDIVANDYLTKDLYQSQLAIWHLTDGKNVAEEGQISADIIKNAKGTTALPEASSSVTSLPDAISQNLVSATLKGYENMAPPPFFYYGKGSLILTNLTDKMVTVYVPYGMTFKDTTQTGVQDMGIFPSTDADTTCDRAQVTVPANGSMNVKIYGYCLDRSATFPGAAITAVSLAPDKVRTAICESVNQGHLKDNLYETQLAVWNAMDGKAAEGNSHEVSTEIINVVNSGKTPGDIGTMGTDLPSAISQKLVSATVNDFKNIAAEPYSCFGDGTMTLTNLTSADQVVYLPYGTIFEDATKGTTQTMGVFVNNGSVVAAAPKAEPQAAALPMSGGSTAFGWLIAVGMVGCGLALLLVGYGLRYKVTES